MTRIETSPLTFRKSPEYVCEVKECEREAEYNCCHPPFFIKDRAPSDKTDTYLCQDHADSMVELAEAIGMSVNITEIRR